MKPGAQIIFWQTLLLFLAIAAQAQFTFTTNNSAITITAYTGTGGDVVIPNSTNGYPVKVIGGSAFNAVFRLGAANVTSVLIPNSVTNIGNQAFSQCPRLSNVAIGTNVISIGSLAFYDCQALPSVAIPASVTSIGGGAFDDCSHITNITVNAANPNYASADGLLFNKAMTRLFVSPEGFMGGYTIPNSVSNLDGAFYSCKSLTSVTIPSGVTSIGYQTFYLCLSLTNVAIPATVTSIGDNAFSTCVSLTNLMIPDGVASIGTGAFLGCSGLTSVVIPGSLTYIGVSAFAGCSSLTSVTIPNNVTYIDGGAFSQCSGLTNVTLGNSVNNLADYAFMYCSGLTSVTIPNTVTNIGFLAFLQCTNLHQACFQGNAPTVDGAAGSTDSTVFEGESGTVFYMPGTTGWGATFGGWLTVGPYQPQPQIVGADNGIGVPIDAFQFSIFWATNSAVVVEASTDLLNWTPVVTNSLVNGTNAFSDSTWADYPQRFYRVRSP